MKEILKQAFQLGQQWTHDINNENEPTDFNTWYNSDLVQQQVKNLNIHDVMNCKCGTELHTEGEPRADGLWYCSRCNNPY